MNLLLVNKSDFLTVEQRQVWTDYFNQQGVYAVFFSALESSEDMGGLPEIPESDEEDLQEEENESDHSDEDETDELRNQFSCLDSPETEPPNFSKSDTSVDCSIKSLDNSESIATAVNVSNSIGSVIDANDNSDDDEEDSEDGYESSTSVPESLAPPTPSITETSPPLPIPSTKNNANSTCSLVTINKLYNRDELITLLESVSPAPRLLQQHTTIGLVGYPNVGKSSTINCLMNEKRVTVSSTPGKTKHFQVRYTGMKYISGLLCESFN